ncbi:MAG: SOS response-associated peptidase [Saprospiraceae bacterium]|nr:SOS response-associated peptidase [Saprospiraceae bacterium]
MCGRFSFAEARDKVVEKLPDIYVPDPLVLSYNIAPSQNAYIITNEAPTKLQSYKWGLLPSWSSNMNYTANLINARAEGIATKPSFSMPIRHRRCLVLADSYYEWRTEFRNKIPYRFVPHNADLLLLAGLWDSWIASDSKTIVNSFCIITVAASNDLQKIHHRMPAILMSEEARKQWLTTQHLNDALSLLQPAPSDYLKVYTVSEKLNSPSNNYIELQNEVLPPKTLFDDFLL